MDVVRSYKLRYTFLVTAVGLIISSFAAAQGLSLTVGNSVAGQDYLTKGAQFVFRVNGCSDPLKLQVSAVAEGVVSGTRRSVPLTLPPSRSNGIYAVTPQWGNEGKWLIAVSVSCLREAAGAIVPVTKNGFVRESTQLLQQAPTPEQVETALHAYTPPPTLQ